MMFSFVVCLGLSLVFFAEGRPLSCPVINETIGSLLCCRQFQSSTNEKQCVTLVPRSSFGLLRIWPLKTIEYANFLLQKFQLSDSKKFPKGFSAEFVGFDFNRRKQIEEETRSVESILKTDWNCCCGELKQIFALEGGYSEEGRKYNVYQELPTKAQVVMQGVCLSDYCVRNGIKYTCQQVETHVHQYVVDDEYPDYLREVPIRIKNGCMCYKNCTENASSLDSNAEKLDQTPNKDLFKRIAKYSLRGPDLSKSKNVTENSNTISSLKRILSLFGKVIEKLEGAYGNVVDHVDRFGDEKIISKESGENFMDKFYDATALIHIAAKMLKVNISVSDNNGNQELPASNLMEEVGTRVDTTTNTSQNVKIMNHKHATTNELSATIVGGTNRTTTPKLEDYEDRLIPITESDHMADNGTTTETTQKFKVENYFTSTTEIYDPSVNRTRGQTTLEDVEDVTSTMELGRPTGYSFETTRKFKDVDEYPASATEIHDTTVSTTRRETTLEDEDVTSTTELGRRIAYSYETSPKFKDVEYTTSATEINTTVRSTTQQTTLEGGEDASSTMELGHPTGYSFETTRKFKDVDEYPASATEIHDTTVSTTRRETTLEDEDVTSTTELGRRIAYSYETSPKFKDVEYTTSATEINDPVRSTTQQTTLEDVEDVTSTMELGRPTGYSFETTRKFRDVDEYSTSATEIHDTTVSTTRETTLDAVSLISTTELGRDVESTTENTIEYEGFENIISTTELSGGIAGTAGEQTTLKNDSYVSTELTYTTADGIGHSTSERTVVSDILHQRNNVLKTTKVYNFSIESDPNLPIAGLDLVLENKTEKAIVFPEDTEVFCSYSFFKNCCSYCQCCIEAEESLLGNVPKEKTLKDLNVRVKKQVYEDSHAQSMLRSISLYSETYEFLKYVLKNVPKQEDREHILQKTENLLASEIEILTRKKSLEESLCPYQKPNIDTDKQFMGREVFENKFLRNMFSHMSKLILLESKILSDQKDFTLNELPSSVIDMLNDLKVSPLTFLTVENLFQGGVLKCSDVINGKLASVVATSEMTLSLLQHSLQHFIKVLQEIFESSEMTNLINLLRSSLVENEYEFPKHYNKREYSTLVQKYIRAEIKHKGEELCTLYYSNVQHVNEAVPDEKEETTTTANENASLVTSNRRNPSNIYIRSSITTVPTTASALDEMTITGTTSSSTSTQDRVTTTTVANSPTSTQDGMMTTTDVTNGPTSTQDGMMTTTDVTNGPTSTQDGMTTTTDVTNGPTSTQDGMMTTTDVTNGPTSTQDGMTTTTDVTNGPTSTQDGMMTTTDVTNGPTSTQDGMTTTTDVTTNGPTSTQDGMTTTTDVTTNGPTSTQDGMTTTTDVTTNGPTSTQDGMTTTTDVTNGPTSTQDGINARTISDLTSTQDAMTTTRKVTNSPLSSHNEMTTAGTTNTPASTPEKMTSRTTTRQNERIKLENPPEESQPLNIDLDHVFRFIANGILFNRNVR